jgi:hypothetical protein
MVSGLSYPFLVYARTVELERRPASFWLQIGFLGAVCSVLLLAAVLIWLPDWISPHLTLARWATFDVIRPIRVLGFGPSRRVPLSGLGVASNLDLRIRRRLKRLPESSRGEILTTCGKLIEVLRLGQMQQHSRARARRTMREAFQYSARIANSRDASEAARNAETWLKRIGLADMPAAPVPGERRIPTFQSIGEATNTVKGILALIGAIVVGVILLINNAGLDKVFSQLQ